MRIRLSLSSKLSKTGAGGGSEMADDPNPESQPKSRADVLAEELDGKVGDLETQELPVEEKQPRLRAVYDRIHEQPDRLVALGLALWHGESLG
jgi:hypothetical protein